MSGEWTGPDERLADAMHEAATDHLPHTCVCSCLCFCVGAARLPDLGCQKPCAELIEADRRNGPLSPENQAVYDALAGKQHDCGHTCCDERHDPMHDHFLAADNCPSCVSGTP